MANDDSAALLAEVRRLLDRLGGPHPKRWDIDAITYDYLRSLAEQHTTFVWGAGAVLGPFTTMVVVDHDLPAGCCGVEFTDGHYESYTY